MDPGELTARKWKPFDCPYCRMTLVRKQIETARLADDSGGRPLRITSSFGVAAFPEDASNPADLSRKADQALYSAKQGGRNRVAHAAEASSRP